MLSKIISNSLLRTTFVPVRGMHKPVSIPKIEGVEKRPITQADNLNPVRLTHPRDYLPRGGEIGRRARRNFEDRYYSKTKDIYDIYRPIAVQELYAYLLLLSFNMIMLVIRMDLQHRN